MTKFNLMLKQARKASGMTQKEVAEKANVSLGAYRTWEQGTAGMSLEMAFVISSVIGCTPNDLCDWYSTHPRTAATNEAPDTQRLLSAYEDLSEEGREVAVNVVSGLTATYPQGLDTDELGKETA